MRVAAQPDLYDPTPDDPLLLGTACGGCGRVSFPPLTLGCDACGAPDEQLQPTTLATVGCIHSIATVHRHRGEPPAPFTVAEIQLAEGSLIRAMVAAESAQELRIGDHVRGVWQTVRIDTDGNEVVEPAFTATIQ